MREVRSEPGCGAPCFIGASKPDQRLDPQRLALLSQAAVPESPRMFCDWMQRRDEVPAGDRRARRAEKQQLRTNGAGR